MAADAPKFSATPVVPTLNPVAPVTGCSNRGRSAPAKDDGRQRRSTSASSNRHDGTVNHGIGAIDAIARRGIGAFLPLLLDVELPHITRVILYGSRARGDYHDESDVDLAVVLAGHRPDSEGDIALRLSRKLTDAILECRLCTQIDVSPMLVWEDELVNPEATSDPGFYRDVVADGLEVYLT